MMVVAGAGLVPAGAELVTAGAGRWALRQEGGRRYRTGSCFCREVVAGVGVLVAGTVSKGIRLDFLNQT